MNERGKGEGEEMKETLHSSVCVSCRTEYGAMDTRCPACGDREAICPVCEPAALDAPLAGTDAGLLGGLSP